MSESSILTAEVTVLSKRGLHLKHASDVARLCRRFTSEIKIGAEGRPLTDARSPLSLMCLQAACGAKLQITAAGEDAEAALKAFTDYFAQAAD